MNQLNNRINLDRAKCAADNAFKGGEKMSHSSTKTPWHLRFAPGDILQKNGIIAVLAIATVLTQAPIEKTEAASTNSLPTFSSLQEGDTIVAMKKKGAKETIAEWLRNIFGGAAGNQLTKQGQTLVAQPAVANTAGTVRAIGGPVLRDVKAETTTWYNGGGSPAAYDEAGFDDYEGSTDADYQYMDYEYVKMKWNADDEIYQTDNDWGSRRYYTSRRYAPNRVNRQRNQGEEGYHYPGHE